MARETGPFFCSWKPCARRSHEDLIIDPHQTLLQTCRALYIQGLFSQALADQFLDAINYNADDTAGCSMSAGIPVLTMAGDRMLSRMGAILNYSSGLESMTVNKVQTFIRTAVELARDKAWLREVREKLSPSNKNFNPLFSPTEFTAGYGHLLISGWTELR